MEKKYELTKQKKVLSNTCKVYRIKALKDFGNIKKGDLGGWIEKEENLSQEGDCWVYHDAVVYEDAVVHNNAVVFDNAVVCNKVMVNDDAMIGKDAFVENNYLRIVNIGIGYQNMTFYKNRNDGISMSYRCFSGTIEEFEKREGLNYQLEKKYMTAIRFAKSFIYD